jgi:16S rRNA (guanine966-N2)-methyltransferase
MRVVAGDLGGRKLLAPRGLRLRPTADKVREAIFSMLGDIEGATVLDLYAGTGALAIEALSRGASSAVLVDTDTRPAERNIGSLGLEDRTTVVRSDALTFLRHFKPEDWGLRTEDLGLRTWDWDLVFLDPPYKLADRLANDLDSLIPPRLRPGARVIVESAAREPLRLSLPQVAERRYGDTLVSIHTAGEAQ